jgi:hypothetical protein
VCRVKGQRKQSVEYPQRKNLECLAALAASLYFIVNSGHDLSSLQLRRVQSLGSRAKELLLYRNMSKLFLG